MSTYLRNRDKVKVLRLKRVGIVLASLWLIVLIAAVAGTIYREIDGPSVRSTVAEKVILTDEISSLNTDLDSVNGTIDQLNADLEVVRSDNARLRRRLDSYISFAALTQIGPNPGSALDILFLR